MALIDGGGVRRKSARDNLLDALNPFRNQAKMPSYTDAFKQSQQSSGIGGFGGTKLAVHEGAGSGGGSSSSTPDSGFSFKDLLPANPAQVMAGALAGALTPAITNPTPSGGLLGSLLDAAKKALPALGVAGAIGASQAIPPLTKPTSATSSTTPTSPTFEDYDSYDRALSAPPPAARVPSTRTGSQTTAAGVPTVKPVEPTAPAPASRVRPQSDYADFDRALAAPRPAPAPTSRVRPQSDYADFDRALAAPRPAPAPTTRPSPTTISAAQPTSPIEDYESYDRALAIPTPDAQSIAQPRTDTRTAPPLVLGGGKSLRERMNDLIAAGAAPTLDEIRAKGTSRAIRDAEARLRQRQTGSAAVPGIEHLFMPATTGGVAAPAQVAPPRTAAPTAVVTPGTAAPPRDESAPLTIPGTSTPAATGTQAQAGSTSRATTQAQAGTQAGSPSASSPPPPPSPPPANNQAPAPPPPTGTPAPPPTGGTPTSPPTTVTAPSTGVPLEFRVPALPQLNVPTFDDFPAIPMTTPELTNQVALPQTRRGQEAALFGGRPLLPEAEPLPDLATFDPATIALEQQIKAALERGLTPEEQTQFAELQGKLATDPQRQAIERAQEQLMLQMRQEMDDLQDAHFQRLLRQLQERERQAFERFVGQVNAQRGTTTLFSPAGRGEVASLLRPYSQDIGDLILSNAQEAQQRLERFEQLGIQLAQQLIDLGQRQGELTMAERLRQQQIAQELAQVNAQIDLERQRLNNLFDMQATEVGNRQALERAQLGESMRGLDIDAMFGVADRELAQQRQDALLPHEAQARNLANLQTIQEMQIQRELAPLQARMEALRARGLEIAQILATDPQSPENAQRMAELARINAEVNRLNAEAEEITARTARLRSGLLDPETARAQSAGALRDFGAMLSTIADTVADAPRGSPERWRAYNTAIHQREYLIGVMRQSGIPEEIVMDAAQRMTALINSEFIDVAEGPISNEQSQDEPSFAMPELPGFYPFFPYEYFSEG